MANIKLGNNTLTGVDKIKVQDADNVGQYVDFGLGGGGIQGGYNVTLNVDNNDWQVISVVAGNSMAFPTAPTKSGYAFGGWTTTQGGTTADVVFPYTPAGNTTLYAVWNTWQCTVANLGSSSTSSVTFTHVGTMPTFQEVSYSGDVFIRIPKMYRKVVATSNSQITSYTIAMTNVDGTYSVYPCFIDENGNELDYVDIGKYMSSSSTTCVSSVANKVSQTITVGRTNARARGTGYQLFDWQMQKLWQDLITCKMNTININSGSGIATDALGIEWEKSGSWIDGIARNGTSSSGGRYLFCYKPSKYINSPSISSDGYAQSGYNAPGSSSATYGCISKLGYDTTNPFMNYPNAIVADNNYATYYCDAYYMSTSNTNTPVIFGVGYAAADCGAFRCLAVSAWSDSNGVRLCYRPLSA